MIREEWWVVWGVGGGRIVNGRPWRKSGGARARLFDDFEEEESSAALVSDEEERVGMEDFEEGETEMTCDGAEWGGEGGTGGGGRETRRERRGERRGDEKR